MAYVSAKVLSEQINIDEIKEQARDDWGKRQRKRRSLEKWIVRLLPVGLVTMTVIFYGLSAPHTAALLTLITPSFGGIAPLGFELGVLTLSALREAGWRSWSNALMLFILLALSVVINIAGAFIAVVSLATNSNLMSDTLTGLLSRFDSLPATIQVVLLLIAPVGAMIPVMAKLTGEAVMKLALGKVTLETQNDDAMWANERAMVVRSALYQAAIKAGAGSKTAGNWAGSVVENIYRDDVRQQRVAAIGTNRVGGLRDLVRRPIGFLGQSHDLSQSQESPIVPQENIVVSQTAPVTDRNDSPALRLSKKDVSRWLESNPQVHHLSNREITKIYMAEKFGVETDAGYKTIERARRELGL